MHKLLLTSAIAISAAATGAFAETSACLITKTDTNPFFVKMREGAAAKAEELGIELRPMPARSTATTKPRWRRSRPASPTAPRAS